MNPHKSFLDVLTSQVGRKILTGITGILLVLFVIAHLSGNLALLRTEGEAFNRYTAFLHSFGGLLIVVEILLGLVFLLHAYIGIAIAVRRRRARANGYEAYQSKGGPSRQSFSSRTMIFTGLLLLVFLVIHVIQFRFGAGVDAGYIVALDGAEARDLYRLVIETFSNIGWVIFYVVVMLFLGFHLRHGVWSALQSIGAMKPSVSRPLYALALIVGLLLAVGFLILPIWIYVNHSAA